MIRQDHYELSILSELPFKDYACKLFCLFYYSEQITNTFFDPDGIINKTLKMLNRGWIDAELAVYGTDNAKKILEYLQVPVKAVKDAPAGYECHRNEIEILKLVKPGFMHFVPGDGKGNYTWDPLGVRPMQKGYSLDSKRIIVLKDGWYDKH